MLAINSPTFSEISGLVLRNLKLQHISSLTDILFSDFSRAHFEGVKFLVMESSKLLV